jgi:hypothetical protein
MEQLQETQHTSKSAKKCLLGTGGRSLLEVESDVHYKKGMYKFLKLWPLIRWWPIIRTAF